MGVVTPKNKEVTALEGLHLYHGGMSNCSMRVRVTLEEKGLPWTSHHLDLRKAENITPEYFGIHPKGLVPALVHDGVVHIESTDIIDYIDTTFDEPSLRSAGQANQEKMLEWMQLAAHNHIHVKTYMFAHQIGKNMAKTESELALYRELQDNEELLKFHEENSSIDGLSEERITNGTEVLLKCFARLDRELDEHKWIVGDSFSLADITWIPLYVTLNNAGYPFTGYPNVARWKDDVRARPSFKKAVLEWVPEDLFRD